MYIRISISMSKSIYKLTCANTYRRRGLGVESTQIHNYRRSGLGLIRMYMHIHTHLQEATAWLLAATVAYQRTYF